MPIPPKGRPAVRQNAKDRVLHTLYEWIVTGVLEPGERLFDEELSSYFGVSRTPVREALQVLAEKQLVEILPARCTRVAPVNLEDLQKIYPLLCGLHGLAMRMALPRLGPPELERLAALNEQAARQIECGDYQGIREADRQFHRYILELADNPYLTGFIEELSLHVYRVETLFFRHEQAHALRRGPQTVDGHRKILAALRDGDEEAAVAATEENWMSAYQDFCDRLSDHLETAAESGEA